MFMKVLCIVILISIVCLIHDWADFQRALKEHNNEDNR